MRTLVTGLVCVLLVGMAFGQANTEPVLKPRANAPVQDLPSAGAEAKVAPDAPVITIQGVCPQGGNAGASSPDCKTVVTRADFEKLVNALQPNFPKAQEKQFATSYATALILQQRAHEAGLDRGPEYDTLMYIARLQLLMRLEQQHLQKEAANISDQDIEAYYNQHKGDFKAISYDKLLIPKTKETDAGGSKLNEADVQKKREASEAAMKEEADKLRARAAAGEDFTKLQQEAYNAAGQKLTAANPHVDNVTEARFFPRTDVAIFQLKPGEVSQVFNDPQGFMVYRVDSVQDQPLTAVREEIKRTLQTQKLQQEQQELQKATAEHTTFDEAYFAVPAAPSLRKPGEAPQGPTTPTAAPGSQPPGKK